MPAKRNPLLDIGLLQSSYIDRSWAVRIQYLPEMFTKSSEHLVEGLPLRSQYVPHSGTVCFDGHIGSASYVLCSLPLHLNNLLSYTGNFRKLSDQHSYLHCPLNDLGTVII